jgi:acyl-coenzyme A thioesterase 9
MLRSSLALRGFVPFNKRSLAASVSRAVNVGADGIGEKTPSASRSRFVIPLSSNADLALKYTTVHGGVRIGRLVEDIDAFGAGVAYNHCDGFAESRPLTVVTASFDKMSLLGRLRADLDIELAGQVTYVGSSSMEVFVTAANRTPAGEILATAFEAKTTMVAREAFAKRPARVHRLAPETDDERTLMSLGKANAERRRQHSLAALTDIPPTTEEVALIHDLFKLRRNSTLSSFSFVSLESTRQKSFTLMHPETRNIHGNVFGGLIMRHGFELAYTTANLFFGSKPQLTCIDEVHFVHPIGIGSICSMDAVVCFKERNSIVVRVEVSVIDPGSGRKDTTNLLFVTFHTRADERLADLMPHTYEEAILMLEGRRKMQSSSR